MKKILLLLIFLHAGLALGTSKKEHHVFINGAITPAFSSIVNYVHYGLLLDRKIYLHVNSTGGLIEEAGQLITLIEKNPDRFACVNSGTVQSAAFMIYITCKERLIKNPSVTFMWHKMVAVGTILTTYDKLMEVALAGLEDQRYWDERFAKALGVNLKTLHYWRDKATLLTVKQIPSIVTSLRPYILKGSINASKN